MENSLRQSDLSQDRGLDSSREEAIDYRTAAANDLVWSRFTHSIVPRVRGSVDQIGKDEMNPCEKAPSHSPKGGQHCQYLFSLTLFRKAFGNTVSLYDQREPMANIWVQTSSLATSLHTRRLSPPVPIRRYNPRPGPQPAHVVLGDVVAGSGPNSRRQRELISGPQGHARSTVRQRFIHYWTPGCSSPQKLRRGLIWGPLCGSKSTNLSVILW
jgi:hypothetical protein